MKIFNLILLILFFSSQSFAIKIIQAKGNKILIDLEEETVAVDQQLYLLNSNNKKIALATITQSKNGRAIAVLNKGKTDGAVSIELIDAAVSAEAPAAEGGSAKTSTKGVYRLGGTKISGVLTIATNSMVTKQADGTSPIPNQEDVALAGSSIGLTGAMDYPFNNWLILRGTLGYEPFTAAATSRFFSCDNLTSKNCNANISYLSAGGYIRFDLTKSRALVWVAGGATTKFPISKTTTALKADDIKMTFTYAFAFGLDYFINNKNFIPASLEYQLFQSSDTVTANIIMLRAGYGWAF